MSQPLVFSLFSTGEREKKINQNFFTQLLNICNIEQEVLWQYFLTEHINAKPRITKRNQKKFSHKSSVNAVTNKYKYMPQNKWTLWQCYSMKQIYAQSQVTKTKYNKNWNYIPNLPCDRIKIGNYWLYSIT